MQQVMNMDLERKVLRLPEFKGWAVQKSDSHKVTLVKQGKEKNEEIVVFSSYVMDL